MSVYLSLEQKVDALSETSAELREVKKLLKDFLDIQGISLADALGKARAVAEHVVNAVVSREKVKIETDLFVNIDTLGSNEQESAKRRGGREPILPQRIYAALHALRLFGNSVVHKYKPGTTTLKSVRVNATDVHTTLALLLQVGEWYFEEYEKGPQLRPLYDGAPESVLGAWSDVPPDVGGFVGRAHELGDLHELLGKGKARVVSVVAPGGMGKSLLAARFAQEQAGAREAGQGLLLWFNLSDKPTFAEVTARALASLHPGWKPTDVELQSMPPLQRVALLIRRLAERNVLLVLDNLETWLTPDGSGVTDPAAARLFQQLGEAAHTSSVLVTSRLEPQGFGVRTGSHRALKLHGLAESDFADLLRSQGLDSTSASVRSVWEGFGGNPRLLYFLVDVVRRRHGGNLERALALQPELLNRTAKPLLQQIWSELPAAGQRILQTLALLEQPTAEDELQRIYQILFPEDTTEVSDQVWAQLVPRDLVIGTDKPAGFRIEHPLISDFARLQWPDLREPHRKIAGFYLEQAAIEPGGKPAFAADPMRCLVLALNHAVAGEDRAIADQVFFQSTSTMRRAANYEMVERLTDYLRTVENNVRAAEGAHREVELVRELQKQFLPDPEAWPRFAGWELACHIRQVADVGGDFCDIISLPHDHLAVVLGDVCDKGLSAARYMALFCTLVRAFAQQTAARVMVGQSVRADSPAPTESRHHSSLIADLIIRAVFDLTNNYIAHTLDDELMFATLFIGILDTTNGELTYINAGHPAALVIRAGGDREALNLTRGVVGLWADKVYESRRTILEPGDTLFACTDGVTDARDPTGQFFAKDRLLDVLQGPVRTAQDTLDVVTAALRNYVADAEPFDDVAMLAVSRTDGGPPR